jgi:uncharacterized protein
MPTRDTPWPNGTPCWVDYGAADLEAAKDFYAALLGWEYTEGSEEYGGYLNALRNGEPAAGLDPRMDEHQPVAWTTYFATDDSAAAVDRIRRAGGTVLVEPMEVVPFGTMTIALDPQGTPFGLWQAAEHTGERIFNEPGSVTWNEASVEDPAAAREFYAAVFGFRFAPVEGVPDYTTFATGDRPLGGLGGVTPGLPKGWLTCFAVADTDRAAAMTEARGGKVVTAPVDSPFGRFAVLEDPWGALFEVLAPAQG